jgi:hypothetical protein
MSLQIYMNENMEHLHGYKNEFDDHGFMDKMINNMSTIIQESTPLIDESTFEKGEYDDPTPAGIPDFQQISFFTMLKEKHPRFEEKCQKAFTKNIKELYMNKNNKETTYDYECLQQYEDEEFQMPMPLAEMNAVEVTVDPGIITGLRNMTKDEEEDLIAGITNANRKSNIPSNFVQALKSKYAKFFVQAVQKEFKGLSDTAIFDMVEVPKYANIIPGRLIFDIKWCTATDKLLKWKARFVCMGYRQRIYNALTGSGSYDPNNISSPVLKPSSLLAILNLASLNIDNELITIDVKQAFLAAKLRTDGTEDIYLSLPPGLIVKEDGKVVVNPDIIKNLRGHKNKKKKGITVKLNSHLYGLKGSSAGWYGTIKDYLIGQGFKQSNEDMCMFTHVCERGSLILGIHVDDMLIAGVSCKMNEFKKNIEEHFSKLNSGITVGDAADTTGVQFLGSVIKKERDEDGKLNGLITLSQENKIESVCDMLNIDQYKKVNLPYEPSKVKIWESPESIPKTDLDKQKVIKEVRELHPEVENFNDVIRCYRMYTGNLVWLCGTAAPQVLPITYKLARFQLNPSIEHFKAVRKVFSYLYAHRMKKLTFGRQKINLLSSEDINRIALTIFCDTSHGDCKVTGRSTGGYVIYLFGCLLAIKSYRLSCVTTSSTQSEYYMMSKAAEEAIYAMELYNNTLLPVINSILQTKHNKVKKLAVMTSGLVDEVITTLNAKSYPLVSEFNKVPIYGDNLSALLLANKGPKKNSKHAMIHASWLYDLIHQLKLLETRKVHTSTNPADITTKQIGMSADTFEKHTRSLLGLNDLVYIDEQNKQVNYLNYNTFGEVKEHTNEEQKINLQRHAIRFVGLQR